VKRHATVSYLAPAELSLIASGKASKTGTYIPSPYNEKKKVCESWAFEKVPGPTAHWGHADSCGASLLSAVDLLRFVTFCTDLLGPSLAVEALTPPKLKKPSSMGLGWGVGMTSNRYQYGHGGAWSGVRAFCESTWDGVQYAVLAAGDRDEQFNKLSQRVVQLGRDWSRMKIAAAGWKRYGFK
jgi:hypothetical protein